MTGQRLRRPEIGLLGQPEHGRTCRRPGHGAAVRHQVAREHLEQSGLADPVRGDNPGPVAPADGEAHGNIWVSDHATGLVEQFSSSGHFLGTDPVGNDEELEVFMAHLDSWGSTVDPLGEYDGTETIKHSHGPITKPIPVYIIRPEPND